MATMSTESTTQEQSSGLKRRQSHSPEPETREGNDSKRQRTSSGKNSPRSSTAHRDDSTEGKKEEAPTATNDRRASNARDARRPSGIGDEKSKAKRLFGGLLGSLAQPSDRTTKRRQEIESRRKAELQQQDDARIQDKQRRAERLAEKRKLVKKRVDAQNMRLRHETILHQANFLQTRAGPKLFYRPWELRPGEEDSIADQIREAKAIVDSESGTAEARAVSVADDITSNKEEEVPGGTETMSSKEHTLSDPTALTAVTKTASAQESNGNGRAESAIAEEEAASTTNTDAEPAFTGVPPVKIGSESDIKEVTTEKEAAEPDDEHMVEGDEDTVIY